NMESTHCKLRAWFTDRLGGNYPYRLTHIDQMSTCQVTAVAHGTDTSSALAGKNRPYLDLFKTRVFNLLDERLVNLGIVRDKNIAGNRIQYVVKRNAAEYAVPDMLDDFSTLGQSRHQEAIHSSAVCLGNDCILCDINKPSGKISGVSRLERRISKTLTGAVCGNKVLKNRKTFAKVRGNRGLDDLAGRLCHQASHTCELAYLLSRAPSTRVGHHVNRVERVCCMDLSIISNS